MLGMKRCPHVVHGHEVLHGPRYLHIVMDYGGKEDLQKHVLRELQRGGTALPSIAVESFCSQATLACDHLHKSRIVHLDLKPSNMMVSHDVLKLTDFGIATLVDPRAPLLRRNCGTLPYRAPETLRLEERKGYDGFAADVWSLGVVFFELDQGPGSLEKHLGWHHGSPAGRAAQADALDTLAQLADSPVRSAVVGRALHGALLLQPYRRWTAGLLWRPRAS